MLREKKNGGNYVKVTTERFLTFRAFLRYGGDGKTFQESWRTLKQNWLENPKAARSAKWFYTSLHKLHKIVFTSGGCRGVGLMVLLGFLTSHIG